MMIAENDNGFYRSQCESSSAHSLLSAVVSSVNVRIRSWKRGINPVSRSTSSYFIAGISIGVDELERIMYLLPSRCVSYRPG
jgi:hypothetical protein